MILKFSHPFSYLWLATIVCFIYGGNMAEVQAQNQEIKGMTGGNKNSGDCGYVSEKPNYVLQLNEQAYSLNVILETQAEKPSLLILGPGESDRFCILGDTKSGKKPQMGGVWAAGKYLIYVGDSQGSQNPFTLKISR
ncbi:hypothetical protein [Cyanobacterium sp. Dongsha4]|uniref:hypothetical protein n=1 Tax=Cyanobacterium sp. DS4 TaxID=2878255 RepID=UPI002E8024D7|nr:hypothetical protein [Cyanobacterium sp. Dongsha4]WVK99655.1 hypothetical protein Dongsha4_13335 [Cyanobacterium sp. Dongsha4]